MCDQPVVAVRSGQQTMPCEKMNHKSKGRPFSEVVEEERLQKNQCYNDKQWERIPQIGESRQSLLRSRVVEAQKKCSLGTERDNVAVEFGGSEQRILARDAVLHTRVLRTGAPNRRHVVPSETWV